MSEYLDLLARKVGWTFTGIVSVWPDTGRVRAELWERSE